MKILALGSKHTICALSFLFTWLLCATVWLWSSAPLSSGTSAILGWKWHHPVHSPGESWNTQMLAHSCGYVLWKYQIQLRNLEITRFNLTNSTTSMPGALEWEVPCMDKWVLILPLVAVEEKWDWIHFLGSSSHSFSKYLLSTFQAPGTVQMLRIYDLIDW